MMLRDLRADFDRILCKWGHDVYLQRVVNPFVEGEDLRYARNSEDRKILEKHTTRHMFPGSRSLGGFDNEAIEGLLIDHDVVYYFRHNVEPVVGDRIYDGPYERIPHNTMTYVIAAAVPMRGYKGQIIFWAVGADREHINTWKDTSADSQA